MSQAARALAEDEALARYFIPLAVDDAWLRRLERAPACLASPFLREARRRQRPAGVHPARLTMTALGSDMARVLAARLRLSTERQNWIAEGHRKHFDRSVARRLGPALADTVIAVQGSALATLRAAGRFGVEPILNATLAHPRFVARLLRPVPGTSDFDDQGQTLPGFMIERRLGELRIAERILVPSSFARASYAQEGVDPERLVVIPLGVDVELFGAEPRREPADGLRVLFVGRLSPLKGVNDLIGAFRKARLPGSELTLIGDASGADPRWLTEPGVRYRPPIPRYLLPALYRQFDVLVLPSLAESYGLVILEAMACGTPVIATTNSIAPDVISDGTSGYVVPIRDPVTLADRLVALGRDVDLRRRMGEAAARAAAGFSWRAYRSRLLAALR